MEDKKVKNNKVSLIFKILFRLSILYYVVWFVLLIKYSITGISSEYVGIHIESLCNHVHTMYYGFDAFCAGIENFVIVTFFIVWYIPLYQLIYIIINFIRKKKNEKYCKE